VISPAQAADLAAEIEKRLKRSKLDIPVGVSNRHCHLTEEHFKILFGAAAEPKRIKDIKQPGFWAADEVIDVQGPKGVVKKIRLVAPYRAHTQIELAVTDAFAIGLTPPVRESGDVKGSAGATLIGPAGKVDIKEGVIVAQRHLHFSPAEAAALGVKSGEVVRVRSGTGKGRSTIFEDVVVRVSDKYSLEFHVDTDEANAAGIKTGDFVHIA
jgi:putative phosphotransacetylase